MNFSITSPSEIVEINHFIRYTQVVEHLLNGIIHHGRTAQVIFKLLRFIMIFQVMIVKHLMDETCISFPVIFRIRFGKCYIKSEVREFFSISRNSSS